MAWVWCLVRLFVPTGSGRQRYRVLAAPNAVSHELPRVTTDGTVNRDTAEQLLAALRRRHPTGRLTVVLDNARYFRNRAVLGAARRSGIHLLFLPPYSPNLNPLERVWKFVKAAAPQGRYQEEFSDFKAVIDDTMDGLTDRHAAEMKTLLAWNFQSFEDTPILTA